MTTTVAEDDERHRLTAVQGLAALSLDALSSVAYGPEAILVVLVAADAAGLRYSGTAGQAQVAGRRAGRLAVAADGDRSRTAASHEAALL
jgi:hypothetical protein